MAQMGKSELASAKKPKGAAGNTGLVSGKAGESGKATSGSGMMKFHKVAFCDLQALHMVLDSPINKAGKLQCVYMKTEDGKLIEIKPYVRIPRTFKLFSGVMLQLLQKLSIFAVGKREKLMRMITNPMTQYLPVNSRKVGLSYSSEKLVSIQKYVVAAENNMDLVFVEYGAYKKGSFDKMLADGSSRLNNKGSMLDKEFKSSKRATEL